MSKQKRYAEAEPLLLAGYAGLAERKAAIPARWASYVSQVGERIVELYRSWDQPNKAAEWLDKLAKAEARASGPPRQ